MRRFLATVIAVSVLVSAGFAAARQQTQQQPAEPANELVRKVVQNELHAADEGHYMYKDRRQTPSGSRTKEMIETKDGVVARLIAINDQPLTPDQKTWEDQRIQKLLSSVEEQRAKKKVQQQDEDRVRRMFTELPSAFIYEYDGTETGRFGELVCLKFHPNPSYNPPSRETSVFRAMNGKLWVDASSQRLAKIQATLFRDVTFGWGILGHLDKGGHFFVEQSKIGDGRWAATDMNIQFTGKALLFKTINLRQIEVLSDFHRVPDDLTLAQGVEYLNKHNSMMADNDRKQQSNSK